MFTIPNAAFTYIRGNPLDRLFDEPWQKVQAKVGVVDTLGGIGVEFAMELSEQYDPLHTFWLTKYLMGLKDN